jgi:ketosteroid isomerase-like protein
MNKADQSGSELNNLLTHWAAAVRAQDIEGVLLDHARDILMFDVVGPRQIQGIEAYRAAWVDQFFPWNITTRKFDLSEINISTGDTVAFATALLDCAGVEGGETVAFKLRLTVGFEKRDGQWLVTHEHHSEPLPIDPEPTQN